MAAISNIVRWRRPKMDLDRTDLSLLTLLQQNARLTNRELAAQVGLAPSTCLGRVKRLTEEGHLRGFHANVAPKSLGVEIQALVAVRLEGNPRTRLEGYLAFALEQREVVEAYQVSGQNDLLLRIAVRDVEHMRDFVMDILADRPEVAHLESSVIYGHHPGGGLPDLA